MGKQYREATGDLGTSTTSPEIRILMQQPGKKNSSGHIQYFTEQAHRDECDVNKIIQKYDKQGLITHISNFEAQFGDTTALEYKECQDIIAGSKSLFEQLPAHIKKRFKQTPESLLHFMDDEANREEAIKLGLIRNDWTVETDGLGEHVEKDKNVVIPPKPDPVQEAP